jgi:hypothetical protein
LPWIGVVTAKIIEMQDSITRCQQAEAALRQSEARFQRIAASVPGVIYQFLWHSDGSVAFPFVSPSCREIYEVEAQEIQADANVLISMIHPEDLEDFNHSIALSIETLRPWYWEGRFILPSGQLKWVQAASIPELQVNGDILWDGLLMDITVRKQGEEALRQAREELELRVEERLAQFRQANEQLRFTQFSMDYAPEAIFCMDANAQFFYVNEAACQLLGYSREELLSMSIHDVDLNFPTQSWSEHWEELKSQSSFTLESTNRASDGRIFPIELSVNYLEFNGQEYNCVFVRDISDRKQAEEALRESEERFRNLVESTSDFIWEVDENALYTYVSPQIRDILGYEVAEVVGKTPFDLMPPEEAYRVAEMISNQVALQRPLTNLENTNLHKDGHLVVLETSGVPFFDKAGNFKGYRGIDRDITKRKQTEEAIRQSKAQLQQQAAQLEQTLRQLKNTQAQLIQTEKMSSLGQLMAGVAHEINNPVSFIYGNINHARRYTADLLKLIRLYQDIYPQSSPAIEEEIEAIDLNFIEEDFPRLLGSMEVGSKRIQRIVESLRNFSRFDEATIKQVDIHQGIDSTLMLLQSRLTQHLIPAAIQVIKNYGNLPLVECYPGHLNQVFMNILNNAIDALDEANSRKSPLETETDPSTIRICTEFSQESTSNPQVVIRIADNGGGMTEEVRLRAFDPFFTTKPVGEGAGLGLAISYQIIVELHKGQLHCNSSPGEGTELVIQIPIGQSRR